jgi:hypothetical protein
MYRGFSGTGQEGSVNGLQVAVMLAVPRTVSVWAIEKVVAGSAYMDHRFIFIESWKAYCHCRMTISGINPHYVDLR